MHRAASPQGAGRTTTGISPFPAIKTQISNRNFSRLESAVTHRKHSPDPKSNRNFRSTNSRTPRTWGRHSCLRNDAEFGHSRIHTEECQWHDEVPRTVTKCTLTHAARPTPHTPFPECVSEANAPPPNTTQLQRSLVNHPTIHLSSRIVATTTSCAAGYLTHRPPISNRSARRLEMPESYTKQRTDPLSNRHKFTHQFARRVAPKPPILRQRCERDGGEVGPELRGGGEYQALDTLGAGGVDVGLAVVDEEGFARGNGEFIEDVAVDLRLGLDAAKFGGEDRHVEVAQPGVMLAQVIRKFLMEIGEQAELVSGGGKALDPIEHRIVEREPHLHVPLFQVCERGGIERSGKPRVLGDRRPVVVRVNVAAIERKTIFVVMVPERLLIDAKKFGHAIDMRVGRRVAKHHAEIENHGANRCCGGSGGSH